VVLAKARAHHARVKAVGVQLWRTPGELAREEDVAQLRGAVDAHGGVGLLRLQIIEVQEAESVSVGCGGHDAAAGKAVSQQVGEQVRREMVQSKALLEAFGGLLARREQRAGVVGKDVDVLVALAQLLGQHPDLGHQSEVRQVPMYRRVAPRRRRIFGDRSEPKRITAHECDLSPSACELNRGGTADPAGGAGEHDYGHAA